MGHATTRRFDLHFFTADKAEQGVAERSTWFTRFRAVLVAKLLADQPPTAAALNYSYAMRALPVPSPAR